MSEILHTPKMTTRPAQTKLSELILTLARCDPNKSPEAAFELGELGPSAKRAAPLLRKIVLRSVCIGLRMNAARALGAIATDAQTIIVLHLALRDEDAGVRETACMALGEIGQTLNCCFPALFSRFSDPAPSVKIAAIEGLALTAPFSTRLAGIIGGYLTSKEDDDIRAAVFRSLGEARVGDDQFLKACLKHLDDEGRDVCSAAADALMHVGAPALFMVTEAIRQNKVQRKDLAVSVLCYLAPDHPEVMPTLVSVLGDGHAGNIAFDFLSELGASAVPDLLRGLPDASPPRLEHILTLLERAAKTASTEVQEQIKGALLLLSVAEEDRRTAQKLSAAINNIEDRGSLGLLRLAA